MTAVCPRASSDTPLLHFYGELDDGARVAFEQHVASCAACAAALAELQQVRSALADRAVVTRSPREWDAFMRHLEQAVDRDRPTAVTLRASRVARGTWLALAATLLLGIALGLFWQQRVLGPRDAPLADAIGTPTLDLAAARHFDRAKLVLLGLAMKDAGSATADDWERERELAALLLPETRLFRLSAADRGDPTLTRLLGDLEAVLLHTAMSIDAEAPELQRIQRMIRGRDLIVRLGLRDTSTRGI